MSQSVPLAVPLFGRYTELTVGPKTPPGEISAGGTYSAQAVTIDGVSSIKTTNEALEVAGKGWTATSGNISPAGWKWGTEIRFTVHATNDSESDDAEIQVYNLSPEAADIIGPGSPVILRSGYFSFFRSIFAGRVKTVQHEKTGGDVITKMTCISDGQMFLQMGYGRTYSRQTPIVDMVTEIFEFTGVPIGYIEDSGATTQMTFLPHVPIRVHLDRIVTKLNEHIEVTKGIENAYKWTFQHGRAYFVATGTIHGATEGYRRLPEEVGINVNGFYLTPGTGLITAAPHNPTDGESYDVAFTSLLIAALTPDMYVGIISNRVRGTYATTKVDYISDGAKHICQCEARFVDSRLSGGRKISPGGVVKGGALGG